MKLIQSYSTNQGSIEPIVSLTGSLSGSSNLSHKKPRNFKPYFITLNHGKFKALAITIRISKFIFQFPSLNFSNYFFLVTFSRKNNLSMGRSQSSPETDESGGGGEGGDTFQSIRNCFPLKQNQVKSDLNCPILLRNQSHRLDSTARVYHG